MRITSLLVILLVLTGITKAQSDNSVITGKVTDQQGEPLPYANVIIKETNNGAATDKNGVFKILSRPGEFILEASFIGYEKSSSQIKAAAGKTTEVNFTLKSISFEIGGIVVTADNEFIPISPETKTKVSSGEIEHIQASSLNDVMELTPGVKTSNATLNEVEKASIRGGDALGTQIVMDGVPVSNSANMQLNIGISTANSGVDLRSIPAENIEEVEIIRGIPSAQYGDLADGLMLVKTRAQAHAPRLKIKYNPNLYEFNLSSGVKSGEWVINGNFNLATSDRNTRIAGDGYTRIAAQFNAETRDDNSEFKNILYITRSFDERKEDPAEETREAWYNRDLEIKYTGNYTYAFSPSSEFNTKLSAAFTNQDSYAQQLVSRDNIVISDRITEGSQEGIIVFGSYLGQKWIKGKAWNLFADANYKARMFTGEFLHTLVSGIEWKDDFNRGKGIQFNPLYPPSLTVPTPRLRTYDEIPSFHTVSIYIEDKITGNLLHPFTLQAGFRYEVYRPSGFDIKGLWGKGDLIKSHNGSFLNPRINFSYNLAEETQVRLSYGITTKAPPLGMVFAQDKYYDIIDTSSVVNPEYPDSNFSIVSTYIKKQANPDLKAYKQKKYEASIDQQIGDVGFSLTGFINKTTGEFDAVDVPYVFYKKSFPDWPDQTGSFSKDTIMDESSRYTNNGWRNIKGIELSFRTRKIPVINTIFKLDAAYTYGEYGSDTKSYFGNQKTFAALGIAVLPMYNNYSSYYKDLLINYRFEIQAEPLGIWITLHIQQQLLEIDGREGFGDTLAVGYYTKTGETVIIPEDQRANAEYAQLSRNIESYDLYEEDRPNKWLINLKVTKSLWDDSAISFYVNNFLNNHPLYTNRRSNVSNPTYDRRNIDIFYGIEFHSSLSGVF